MITHRGCYDGCAAEFLIRKLDISTLIQKALCHYAITVSAHHPELLTSWVGLGVDLVLDDPILDVDPVLDVVHPEPLAFEMRLARVAFQFFAQKALELQRVLLHLGLVASRVLTPTTIIARPEVLASIAGSTKEQADANSTL
jgi:hypothetical protein